MSCEDKVDQVVDAFVCKDQAPLMSQVKTNS